MNNETNLLLQFGKDYHERVTKALADIKTGKPILLVDDEDRENEGDLIVAAEKITSESMAMMIRECSGIVCLCMKSDKLDELELPQMVTKNTSSMGTAFTITIEAKEGVTTGVSAADRVQTIKTAIAPDAKPDDLASPGHVFPLRARPNGVLERRGHTEGSVDLAEMAGLIPAGVLCELTNPDGTMARLPEICEFAQKHDMVVLSIQDIFDYKVKQIDKVS